MLENISRADNLLFLVLSIFACYRLAQFIAFSDAPFGLMKRIRLFFGKKAGASKEHGFWWSMAELVNCPYCTGLWIALLLAIILFPDHIFLYWLAIAGGQSWLENISQSRAE